MIFMQQLMIFMQTKQNKIFMQLQFYYSTHPCTEKQFWKGSRRKWSTNHQGRSTSVTYTVCYGITYMRERAGNVSRQLVLDFSFCNQFGANSFQNSFCFAIGKVIRIVVCRCNFNQPIDLKIVPYLVRSWSWSVHRKPSIGSRIRSIVLSINRLGGGFINSQWTNDFRITSVSTRYVWTLTLISDTVLM